MAISPPAEGSPLYILFAYAFPTVGVFISAAFSLSPLPRLVHINRDGDLKGYDPLPPTLNLGGGVAWVCYSVMARNAFTFASGAVAAAASTYALLVSHAAAARPARVAVEHLAMSLMGIFLATSLAVMVLAEERPEAALAIVGLIANLIVLAVYVAPLKNMALVVRTKDSSSIYAPWSALQFVNNLLWTVYGLCVLDVWIIASSAFGVAAAGLALLLKVVYPVRADHIALANAADKQQQQAAAAATAAAGTSAFGLLPSLAPLVGGAHGGGRSSRSVSLPASMAVAPVVYDGEKEPRGRQQPQSSRLSGKEAAGGGGGGGIHGA